MKIHEKYIKRCIEIGKNGLGTTAPNPMVGCVIVHNDNIIGEGYTSPYGGNHAEINALNSVEDKSLLKQSTLYVTLEPCSHFGKTPPCSDAIIRYQIPKVVIGTIDTHSKVAGKGIEKLKNAGCEVLVGILEEECKIHHKRFFTFHNKKRPYIILKWAETKDGFIAPKSKTEQKPVWITNEISRQLVHKWRAEEQSILVGTNTVVEDNPSLTVRDWTGKHPIRVVLDKNLKLDTTLNVFNNDAETIILSDENINFEQPLAKQICAILFQKDINSVIVEGGRQTLQTFIDENLWDEARMFVGNQMFQEGTKAPIVSGKLLSEEHILEDILRIYDNGLQCQKT
ncbi:bifunctional diaminohydroxyphosphoribosylaminopyrimidine deaminase/5-amino-6-(5-phosphoribosylamino)uracil reductase RibD [Subsaxibacter sp. CAU 1640]|uniref:bifunctional diaminohydroxyphosphoribosylaminopyrimidine deaminase/5-amino-6-(5-phosphoribosylamino)uracil reductase RibD n=1 Tax=Subsaxibacter sp. CAU 1640 TaxID=2933271 RepID=UPI002003AFAB|nr:bifunctional diaminohydroxyphosphoribosylaminopyrimidine deaminase/5-amino-6-(5-phosphoribosylamino)uracil reductase RibD [Subsaxibacter sp. CAU 1640]MCK7590851.1 bifunctional diaminohydroxyphosphoribosylaminopyrimidine deaminase/5-amino-6-(5-phosphoribosylamino)uracil reductase RibD [Subsaxibacter sp. CAU 1640]